MDPSVFLLEEDKMHSYEGASIFLKDINVLPQPRKTFEDIEELSIDIKKHGLLEPLMVAFFDQESAKRYIEVINHLWETSFDINDLRVDSAGEETLYYVLIAGERRIRACRLLWEKRSRKKIDVRLCINIRPLPALFRQLSENTHKRVPPHEEANAYYQLFMAIREYTPNYSLARFASNVGRNPTVLRKALQFCELPFTIREPVENGLVSYGIALQITRIHRSGEGEEQLKWWLLRAITENYKVYDFQKLITQHLHNKNSGQISLLDIMEEEQRLELEKPHFRSVVGKNIVRAIWSWIGYTNNVLHLFESGELGKEDSPFSEQSPLRVLVAFVEIHQRILPHLVDLMSKEDLEKAQVALEKVRVAAQTLHKKPS